MTRRSHACLTAADPRGAIDVTLLRLDDRAVTEEGTFELGCIVPPNATIARPAGHRLLESFTVDPWPTWRYRLGATVIEKSLMLVYEHAAVVVSYRHLEGPAARITTSPVVALRPRTTGAPAEHPGASEADATNGSPRATEGASVQAIPGRARIQLSPDTPMLTVWHNGAFLPGRAWTPIRHADDLGDESAFLPGCVEGTCAPDAALHVVASLDGELFRTLAKEARLGSVPPRKLAECVAALEADERERLAVWAEGARVGALVTVQEAARARDRDPHSAKLEPTEWTLALARALQAGLVHRGTRLTIATTMPHPVERGAETMRAMLGLLAIRSFDAARDIVRGYLEYLNEGRAPERFEPDGTPVYGDAGPGLWLVIAGERYVRRSEDVEFARGTLYPALEELMRACRSGAPGGIRVDSDGLLVTALASAGSEAAEPLRARSKRRRTPQTSPLEHKRADLNALWYHASVAMSQLARMVGRKEHAAFYLAWAHEHQTRFLESFWDPTHKCLYESLCDGNPVEGLAPSQLWTVSTAPSLLPRDRALELVATIDRRLASPFGLKASGGSEDVRIEWLATFLSAYVRAHGRSPESLARARARIGALCEWMEHEGLGALPDACAAADTLVPPAAGRFDLSPLAASSMLRLWVEDLEHAKVLVPESAGVF